MEITNIETVLYPFIAGPFISIVVGLLSKTYWPSWVKAVLNLGFSAISGVLLQIAATPDGVEVGVGTFVVSAIVTWVTSIATYFGFWKPTGVAEAALKVGS